SAEGAKRKGLGQEFWSVLWIFQVTEDRQIELILQRQICESPQDVNVGTGYSPFDPAHTSYRTCESPTRLNRACSFQSQFRCPVVRLLAVNSCVKHSYWFRRPYWRRPTAS